MLEVWQALGNIPFGTKVTYGQLAESIRRPRASRAVGRAIGLNPVSIIIPCHRVVGSKGKLTGYAGGLGNKERLLQHENEKSDQLVKGLT
jgi:O-6-methylguanine DNA methyltransferase